MLCQAAVSAEDQAHPAALPKPTARSIGSSRPCSGSGSMCIATPLHATAPVNCGPGSVTTTSTDLIQQPSTALPSLDWALYGITCREATAKHLLNALPIAAPTGPGRAQKSPLAGAGLSTDFSCFDSALRSIYGRCGRFAYLMSNFGAEAQSKNGLPVTGVLATAKSCLAMMPARWALRPASMAWRKAAAMRTGWGE